MKIACTYVRGNLFTVDTAIGDTLGTADGYLLWKCKLYLLERIKRFTKCKYLREVRKKKKGREKHGKLNYTIVSGVTLSSPKEKKYACTSQ